MFDINRYFKEYAQQCRALPYGLAYELGIAFVEAAVKGEVRQTVETAAILASLNNVVTLAHPNAPEMIAGLCAAVFAEDIAKSPEGFFTVPGVKVAVENCGTGGDTLVTPNVSCLAAFCAASAGVTVIKHGSRSHTDAGKSGSSDFFMRCGIPMDLPVERMRKLTQTFGLGYIDAEDIRFKRIHGQTMRQSRVSHLNHLIGPITSPAHPLLLRRRVMGVNQTVDPLTIAKVYQILNREGVTHMEHLMLVRGFGDDEARVMDEVSLTAVGTQVVTLRNDDISQRRFSAEDFGLKTAKAAELCVPEGRTKGEYSLEILAGDVDGPILDLICANTALLLHLDDPSCGLPAATQRAEELFRSGGVASHLKAINRFVQG